MPGNCEFMDPDNGVWDYGFDTHHDYDFADEDKEQCLQSCLQKRRSVKDAAGCNFRKWNGQCNFIKTGMIIGGYGNSDIEFIGTCWKFGGGNVLYSLIFLHNIPTIRFGSKTHLHH